MKIGYALSSEEHGPRTLVRNARLAEEAGFDFIMISDHFHPWTDKQGNSPFVWSVLGGIAEVTTRIGVGTGVTCPIIRIHPAIVAHAAATAAAMLPGRFTLGLGTGENLNEHVVGAKWPPSHLRRDMLAEAVRIIRELWTGEQVSIEGEYFTVENARLYTLPEIAPPIAIAASGPKAAELAGEIGDGLIATSPDEELIDGFASKGGAGKPVYGQLTLSWAKSEAQAKRTAIEWWPTTAIPGELSVELPVPAHYEQALRLVRDEDVVKEIACGPDLDVHRKAAEPFLEAGFDHLYFHQVGPDQDGFLEFASEELLPALRERSVKKSAGGRAAARSA